MRNKFHSGDNRTFLRNALKVTSDPELVQLMIFDGLEVRDVSFEKIEEFHPVTATEKKLLRSVQEQVDRSMGVL